MTGAWQLLAALPAGVAVAGLVQGAVGWLAFERFQHRAALATSVRPPITVLKPLHGTEPLLEDALASFCAQDYPAFQIVFGLQDPADPALQALDRLRVRFPHLDMTIVVDATPHGANRKISNLINMLPQARHDILVIADSDIHASPDYLDSLASSLLTPGVGLVTTLYAGLPAHGSLTGRFGAAQINHSFLPGALMARGLGREDCLGATMALRRETLDRIGGLPALSDHLADDAVLGRLVQAEGLSVALASTVPATTVPETRLPELLQHELRWARTIRSLAPVGFALSALQYPLFWAAVALAMYHAPWSGAAFVAAWTFRALTAHGMDQALGVARRLPIWCLPLRDALSVAVMLASYRTDRVAWRGRIMRATRPALAPHVPSFGPDLAAPRRFAPPNRPASQGVSPP